MAANDYSLWIKLYESFLDWHWYHDEFVKSLYIHCLLKAYKKPSKYGGEIIPQGSFVTSSIQLADELNTTRQKIRTALEKLVSTNDLTTKTTNKKTIINVVNWGNYQADITKNNQQNNQDFNHQLTIKQPTNNQRLKEELKTLRHKELKEKVIINNNPKESVNHFQTVDYVAIANYWNEHSKLKDIRSITEARKPNVNARIKEFGLDAVYEMIDNAGQSPFLRGDNSNGFVATFDWCFKPKNFPKVLEGNYLPNKKNKTTNDFEERVARLNQLFPDGEV
jgi:hypothetical protein